MCIPPFLSLYHIIKSEFKRIIKKARVFRLSPVLALPIFPGRRQPSIVGRNELNYRVRNGNGWTLALISTNLCHPVSPENKLYYTLFALFCQEISIPKPQTSATFAIRKGKAAEGTSFRTCAEACGPQLALTW